MYLIEMYAKQLINNNKTMNITILDFNNYEVKLYSNVNVDSTDIEQVEKWIVEQGFNLDEVQFMAGEEPMNIDTEKWDYQIN